jgi:pyridoxamine 5'-phosphate oxidase
MDSKDIASLREDYAKHKLDAEQLKSDPFDQFKYWWDIAMDAQIQEPNAMTLSTISENGFPASRIVLLKGMDDKGYFFYTNYNSRKAKEMELNPNVSILFLWKELQRQVRIEGRVEKLEIEASTAYFQSRPLKSQLGAWTSPQSEVIKDRAELENLLEQTNQRFEGEEVLPCPPFWGGYRIVPSYFEFWQGRSSRLHDRFRYVLQAGEWKIDRLAP